LARIKKLKNKLVDEEEVIFKKRNNYLNFLDFKRKSKKYKN